MNDERRFTHLLCGQIYVREPEAGDDEAIAGLASAQEGVVGRRQLLDLRVGERPIEYRLARGRLRLLHPGVYAVGHDRLSSAGRALAGVMAVSGSVGRAGPDAAASHLTSVSLRGLIDAPPFATHVTVDAARRRRQGLVIHRAVLPGDEIEFIGAVPVTTVARAALDLSATMGERPLRGLIKRAEFKGLVTIPELAAILARYPRRRGRGTLARLVRRYELSAGPTASDLEDEFVGFCRARHLPLPETNVWLSVQGRWVRADCVWRDAKVIVELDGYEGHGKRMAFEDDRARDRALISLGWIPMRVTSRQVEYSGDTLERELRATLAARGGHDRQLTHTGGG